MISVPCNREHHQARSAGRRCADNTACPSAAASLVGRLAAQCAEPGLATDFAAEHGPEQLPRLAFEPPQLDLLDRGEIDRAGVDRDPGQKVCSSEIPEVCG